MASGSSCIRIGLMSVRLIAAEYCVTAPSLLGLGAGAVIGPGVVLLQAVRPVALPYVDLVHGDLDSVV